MSGNFGRHLKSDINSEILVANETSNLEITNEVISLLWKFLFDVTLVKLIYVKFLLKVIVNWGANEINFSLTQI